MKLKKVCQILELSAKQVTRLRVRGVLKAKKLDNGQYEYDPDGVHRVSASRRITKGRKPQKELLPPRLNVLYVRASRGGSDGLDRQLKRLKAYTDAYCRKHSLEIPTKVCKDYYSGDEGVRRSGFRSLFQQVAKGRIARIYAISMDRFYRGERAFLEIALGQFGTKAVFLDEIGKKFSVKEKSQIDLERAIYATVARQINARWAERVKATKKHVRESLDQLSIKARKRIKQYKAKGMKMDGAVLRTLIGLYDNGVRNKHLLERLNLHVDDR